MAYQVLENSITVNVSDEISVFPDKTTPTPDDDGVIMYYELLNLKESKSILWREKIGEGLKKHLKDVTIPKAILTDFPQGYKLYAHRKKYPKKEERTDIYLFGRHKFRSPNEFIPHLIWLVSDKSGQCHCKYCNKSATTNEGRKVPVPSETRSKRRRDADTSDEAPRSKRMTRASSANKVTDNRKRVFDDNRKRYTENQRKATDNRKKAAADNRKKNSRKSSTKKRKSKVELDINVPPPVPKYAVFREGEIVWLAVNKILNDKTLAECNEVFSIEHWPAIVGSITPQGDNDESTIYTVKPLILHGNENVTIDSLRPWLAYSPKESLGGNRFTRSLLNIDLDKATPDQIVEIYFKAIQKVNEIAKVFTPMYQYDYLKAKGIKEKHDGIHFKAMYFGAELIYEDDLVRLLSEDQSESADEGDKHKETKGTYLQVTSIFENKQGFQVTGDLYERDKLLEKGEYEWMPKNKMDEEYTINVSDIAGRFYPTYPDITKSFACEHLKTFENRVLMLGEDVPPTIEPNSKAAISPSTTVTPNDLDTPKHLTTKQTGKRTSPLPPILTALKDKHPVPFSLSQNEKSNRMMGEHLEVDINEKTNTSVEIKIGDDKDIITIKQTSEEQDTKSIEKVGSPVKFSDIEKRYTKKSDDIDFQPLVVSPDTPTFETDDEGDVWSKINVNNDNDSK